MLWADAASFGPQIALCETDHAFHHDTLTVSWSDVQGGGGNAYVSGSTWTLLWGPGNIDTDPLFVGADGPHGDPNRSKDND